jgi:UDP-N-acetylmuramate dehydrogenase
MIHENYSLKNLNTFKIDVRSRYLSEVNSLQDIYNIIDDKIFKKNKHLVLGGGSNVLFTKDFDGLTILNRLKGIEVVNEDANHIYVKGNAGEIWHLFVLHCVNNNWGGLENLSLIPGCVGAAPMQNIGAYGVEIKDTFYQLEAIEIATQKLVTFNKSDCEFGYRESIFKNKAKNQYIITSVTFKLDKSPRFNTSYGAIEQELEKMKVTELTIKNISQAVINIRKSKLPDPNQIGNAGSFFKNPVISYNQFNHLKEKYPQIVSYPADNGVKIAAGWLIEQCGWKGFREKDYGVHQNQALVLVNYGSATGTEIYQLSEQIIQSIKDNFGITLEREVNII